MTTHGAFVNRGICEVSVLLSLSVPLVGPVQQGGVCLWQVGSHAQGSEEALVNVDVRRFGACRRGSGGINECPSSDLVVFRLPRLHRCEQCISVCFFVRSLFLKALNAVHVHEGLFGQTEGLLALEGVV